MVVVFWDEFSPHVTVLPTKLAVLFGSYLFSEIVLVYEIQKYGQHRETDSVRLKLSLHGSVHDRREAGVGER